MKYTCCKLQDCCWSTSKINSHLLLHEGENIFCEEALYFLSFPGYTTSIHYITSKQYIKSFLFCFRLVENINLSFAQYKSTQCELDDFPSPVRRPVYFWIFMTSSFSIRSFDHLYELNHFDVKPLLQSF